jgi:hypothetical protein
LNARRLRRLQGVSEMARSRTELLTLERE